MLWASIYDIGTETTISCWRPVKIYCGQSGEREKITRQLVDVEYWIPIIAPSNKLGQKVVWISQFVQSNPLNGYASGPTKCWTNRRIEPLTAIFYYVSTETGPTKTWTNSQIEPLSGDPLSGLDCTWFISQSFSKVLHDVLPSGMGLSVSQPPHEYCCRLCER